MAHTGLNLNTSLRTSLKQKLSPEQQLSFQLLQMSQLDLEAYLREELNSNPFLALDEAPAPPIPMPVAHDFSRSNEPEDNSWIENMPERESGFYERIIEQVEISNWPESLRQEIIALVPYLNEHGFLPVDCPVPGWDAERYAEAVTQLQRLEPAGIGARNTRESLLLQAASRDLPPLVDKLIEHHLEAVASGEMKALMSRTGVDEDELRCAILALRQLSPYPLNIDNDTVSVYTRPDAVAEKRGQQYVISGAIETTIKPGINEEYKSLIKDPSLSKEEKDNLRLQYRNAQNLLRFCDLRESTIMRVAKVLVREQQQFLHEGPSALKPLSMKQVADELELHESTISRAVQGKTLLTDRGLIAFRNFFVQKVSDNLNGGDVVGAAVQEAIRDLMRIESKERQSKPFSDQEIVDILSAKGLKVARRTINKYRSVLDIPSRSERRKRYRLESFTDGTSPDTSGSSP